eukprot:5651401-Amphidinium_carterae.2
MASSGIPSTPGTGVADGFAVVYEAQSGVTIGAGSSTVEALQQPRLKAPAPPPPQSTTPRPLTAAQPTSRTSQRPTGTAGQSGASTTPMATPMETDNEQADDTMGAQSISSASQSSTATTIVMDIESMMWDTVVTPQCARIVLRQLVEAEFTPQFFTNNNEHLKVLTTISNSASIQRDRGTVQGFQGDRNSARLQGHSWRQ